MGAADLILLTVVIFCVCVFHYLMEMDGVTGASWPILQEHMVPATLSLILYIVIMVLDGVLLTLRDYDLNAWLMVGGFLFAGIFGVTAALTEKDSQRSLLFSVASGCAGYAMGLKTSRVTKKPNSRSR